MGVLFSYITGNHLSREEVEFKQTIGTEPIRVYVIGPAKSGKATLLSQLSMDPMTCSPSRHSLSFETCNVQFACKTYQESAILPHPLHLSLLYEADAIILMVPNHVKQMNDKQVQKMLHDLFFAHACKIPLLICANHFLNKEYSCIQACHVHQQQSASVRTNEEWQQLLATSCISQVAQKQVQFVSCDTGEGIYNGYVFNVL